MFATLIQSGKVTQVLDQGNLTLFTLEFEPQKPGIIVEVYGKARDLVKERADNYVVVTGNLFNLKGALTLNANSITVGNHKQFISCLTLCGRLGGDPETRFLDSGKSLTNFFIAVNGYRDGSTVTSWFNCTAWEKKGETIAKFHSKGSVLAVSGSIKSRSYEKKDGTTGTSYDVNVRDFYFMPKSMGKSEGNSPSDSAPAQAPAPQFAELPY